MSRNVITLVLALLVAGAGVAAFAYTRFATPEPVVETPYECTTCDARQKAKKRLRDHLQSKAD